MKRIYFYAVSFLPMLTSPLSAQDAGNGASAPRKQASAARVAGGTIRVDGRLDDQAWRQAAPITDFVQKEPDEGAPPTEGMDGSNFFVVKTSFWLPVR